MIGEQKPEFVQTGEAKTEDGISYIPMEYSRGNDVLPANILTVSRIVLALALIFLPGLSLSFAVLYVLAGLTDMLDGWVARRTGTASEAGARLDTVADIVFVIVCLIKILPVIVLPTFLWTWTVAIATIKLINIISGFVTQRKFVAVHSILNRLTGLLLFLFPLTLAIVEIKYTGSVVCIIATLAAIQEGHMIRTGSFVSMRPGR